jgi:hypothetical protein
MFENSWLGVVAELGKLIEIVQYLSGFEPETPRTGV